ncbi:penicillin-binding protein 2 [Neisseria bacilliformis ATCC BAA-1200]|uniref:Peptidoglycan D,D-transpeptidase MrdA n=1 Tax=Neisseria bacilliformis ATCC BAA-1200 TaxID=888742 RepID=F2BDQ6_9NEIS|nr:penicillin-binding protein 2 [Neisseria bacilliformis]EGF10437.1 penicillin-binding protein 2 [Neisseria bacilliformis ATCC BAA-1200]QMT46630.1 penicillin-binding protein 2 [Neisseria bacilliformis]
MKKYRPYPPSRSDNASVQRDFRIRLFAAFVFVFVLFGILAARFAYLQIHKHGEFTAQAASNRISLIPTPPIRGEIVDANGVVLAHNYPAYSLEIIPGRIEGKLDDTVAELQKLAEITETDLKRFKKFRAEYRSYEKIPLKLKLTPDEASRIAARLYRLPGVEINARTFREYPYGEQTAHFLGYIGRISDKDQARLSEEKLTALYRGSTHIGKSGLESYYERQLLGVPGYREVEKDAYGNVIRTIKTVPPQNGQTLKLAMDIRLQQYAMRLMKGKRGAMVAIDPQTGGVLAFVSNPSFDPNLFIDGIDSESWKALNENWQKPMINRVTQGLYPPGSTFKPFMGMTLLESGKIGPGTVVPAPGTWSIPGTKHMFRDSVRSGHGSANLMKAIQVSSDTFFYRLGFELGIEKAHPYLSQFGLGQQTGIDLPHEYRGVLPSPEWKEKRFAKLPPARRKWNVAEMVPISIGQGYNAYTPLQMAHATATLANNGTVYRPHLVKELLDHNKQQITLIDPKPVRTLPFKQAHFNYIKAAMAKVLQPGGTARKVGAGLKYSMGGKTGTAQVVQIAQGKSYNAAALAVQHRDHAWFIAFAPLDKPKIAIAVILENGGWGANAAPLARALSDYYLLTLKAGGDREIPVDNSGKTTVANPLLAGGAVQRPSENPVTRAFRAAQPEAAQTPASAPVSDGLPASAASEPKP